MRQLVTAAMFLVITPLFGLAAGPSKAPATVKELWADFDPRKDALDTKVVREWEKHGIVYRCVTFHIGTCKDKPAPMAGFFGFPKRTKKLPGQQRTRIIGNTPPAKSVT
ncbi:hypothetical protein BH11PLA2_BH11PLA2_43230 [soil metagenome]